MLLVRTLLATELVAVRDARCSCPRRGPGPEEEAASCDLVLPRAGVFRRDVAGRSELADGTRALFYRTGEVQRVAHPADGGDRCTVLSLAPAVLRGLARERDPGAAERASPLPEGAVRLDAAADRLHRTLARACAAGVEPLAAEEAALALVAHVLSRAAARPPAPATAARRDLARAARAELARRLSERLSLADVARAVGASPWHLSRVFREVEGATLTRHHLRLRLRAALERLLAGERDLTALALELGFAHHSHFANAFRAELGVPPSACRARGDGRLLRELAARLA